MIFIIEKGIRMKKFFSIICGIFVLGCVIVLIGCDGDSGYTDYMADYTYESTNRIELTGEIAYDLTVIPSSVTLVQGESVQLYVTGGAEPYGDWVVAYSKLGTVDSSDVYTASKKYTGANIVSITDAAGTTVSITITVTAN
jgi:hypothetical protein